MTKSSYLAIDPGLTSGWATFDDAGIIIEMGQFTMAELMTVLKELIHADLKTVIVEDYVNYGWKQQKKWTRNDTSKIIGKIETLCELLSIPIVLQAAMHRPVGYMYAGLVQPKDHSISHQYDAYAHGVFWLQTNGIRAVGKAMKHD